jgi:hypothetical protein
MATRPTGQASPRIIVRRVGACIYCRTTTGKLADEHIVPAALNGNKVLVAACCEPCRVATSRYENTFLESIRLARYALGMGQARRRKKKKVVPATAPVRLTTAGQTKEVELPFDEHPNAIALPIFRRARVLVDEHGDQSLATDGEPVILGFGAHPIDVAKKHGAEQVTLQQALTNDELARTLAKIAYCDAVGVFGLDAFIDVPVLPAICDGAADIGRWVGTIERERPAAANPNVLCTIQMKMIRSRDTDPWVVHALVRLFSNAPAPVYEVVVGQLHRATVPQGMRVEGSC